MSGQSELIRNRLDADGRCIVEVPSDEWWIREQWRLDAGAESAYVTLLVDPADMEKTWAAVATKTRPLDYAGEMPRFVLPFERLDAELDAFATFVETILNPA